jgi:MoxR-like ATPase
VYGIRKGSTLPPIQRGDLFLMRVSKERPGVRGIWVFESKRKVEKASEVPWADGPYEWLLFFSPLVLEFAEPFDEDFRGRRKSYSSKLDLHSGQLMRSIVPLGQKHATKYVEALGVEKEEELRGIVNYLGRPVVVGDILRQVIGKGRQAEPVPEAVAPYLLLRMNVESPWKDEEGRSCHYGTTVPNWKSVIPGAQFLIDRRFPEGKKIIATGKIASVVKEPTESGTSQAFRALFQDYQVMKPPRVVTPEIESSLQALPGYNPQHSIRVLPKEQFQQLAQLARAWIFQANPDYFDVRSAVRKLREDTWLVTAHAEEIGVGDRVYLWESGPVGGIVATAEILDRVASRPEPAEVLPFIKEPKKFEGERPRVRLRILQALDPIVTREEIASHVELSKLSIIQQPQGTNFPVSREEAEVLEDLVQTRQAILTSDQLKRLKELYAGFHPLDEYIDWERKVEDARKRYFALLEARDFESNGKLEPSDLVAISALVRKWSQNIALKVIGNIVKQEGLESFCGKLHFLLYGKDDELPERIQKFCTIQGMKVQTVTQFLSFQYAEKYPFISDQQQDAIKPSISEDQIKKAVARLPYPKERMEKLSETNLRTLGLMMIFSELRKALGIRDYFELNMFLWQVYDQGRTKKPTDEYVLREWVNLTPVEVGQIADEVLSRDAQPLAIDKGVVERILHHLIVGKHVVLYGPPGTGKTDLARRLIRACSKRILGREEFTEAVASYEWGRYEVVGGNSLEESAERFRAGCVTAAIKDGKFLLIDEFNRADMNKAFGEMFMAVDHGKISLRDDEQPSWLEEDEIAAKAISIPQDWRMICTMNDYDKSLLNELSYGLLRRFAYVEIDNPRDKDVEKSVVIQRIRERLQGSQRFDEVSFNEATTQKAVLVVDRFLDFTFRVRASRKIGVATSIDALEYVIAGLTILGRSDPWALLNEALIDYFLPQLDRLDLEVIRTVHSASMDVFRLDDAPIKQLDDFNARLNSMIKELEDLDKLFATR